MVSAGVPRAGGAARHHPARGRRQPRERLAAGDVRPRQQGQGGQQQGSAQQGHGGVVGGEYTGSITRNIY